MGKERCRHREHSVRSRWDLQEAYIDQLHSSPFSLRQADNSCFSHFTGAETEGQRDEETCLGSTEWMLAALLLALGSTSWQASDPLRTTPWLYATALPAEVSFTGNLVHGAARLSHFCDQRQRGRAGGSSGNGSGKNCTNTCWGKQSPVPYPDLEICVLILVTTQHRCPER